MGFKLGTFAMSESEEEDEEEPSQRLDLLLIEKLGLDPSLHDASDAQKYEAIIQMEQLQLDGHRIGAISGLDTLGQLRHLSLRDNRLRTIHGLSGLQNLEILSLSGNELRTITGLRGLTQLRTVDLSDNMIEAIDSESLPTTFPPLLASLQLNGNPIARSTGYRAQIVSVCAEIMELDCVLVSTVERVASNRTARPVGTPRTVEITPRDAPAEALRDGDVYDDVMAFANARMLSDQQDFMAQCKDRSGRARAMREAVRADFEVTLQESAAVCAEMNATRESTKKLIKMSK